MKAFLICPVRGIDPIETEHIVKDLERDGYEVHWPHRDTDQNDDSGLRICMDNRKAIEEAHTIFIIWDGKSQGCLFDMGMAFALKKKVIPIQLPAKTTGKSFQNAITDLHKKQSEILNNSMTVTKIY